MSSEIYELMKRPDEQYVVDRAHRRPRFVEDSVREMVRGVLERFPDLPDDAFVHAHQANFETIHTHDVEAERSGLVGEIRRGDGRRGPHGAPPDPARVARRRVPVADRVGGRAERVRRHRRRRRPAGDRRGDHRRAAGARREPGGDAGRAAARLLRDRPGGGGARRRGPRGGPGRPAPRRRWSWAWASGWATRRRAPGRPRCRGRSSRSTGPTTPASSTRMATALAGAGREHRRPVVAPGGRPADLRAGHRGRAAAARRGRAAPALAPVAPRAGWSSRSSPRTTRSSECPGAEIAVIPGCAPSPGASSTGAISPIFAGSASLPGGASRGDHMLICAPEH